MSRTPYYCDVMSLGAQSLDRGEQEKNDGGGLEGPGFKGVENRETTRDNKNIGMSTCKGKKRKVDGQCFNRKDRVGMRDQARQRDIRKRIQSGY